ncbi:substrate-binding periplasmic protein [Castellaniella caeni]|uniref:substrate-binding periplasmic protein n=1 Tax=Castellaniella caeni TaxID=266123 RepID=UPI0015E07EFD|nr:transporter substrate-binding domain-containing protein [Castellaniella caeni]
MRLSGAGLCLMLVCAWSAQGASVARADGWTLGVADVPSAPAPGAKPRTPLRLEVLAAQAAEGSASVQAVPYERAVEQLADGQLDAWIGVVPLDSSVPAAIHRKRLDVSVSPVAILRSDTDIHDWSALAGRTVCLSADGRYVGELAARFAALEQVYPSATDALLALRTGACDAAVQDEGFLRQLLKYPEWRKFSAQLQPYRKQVLERLSRADAAPAVRDALRQATAAMRLQLLAAQQARDIAFEVYLDQSVPDCH